MHPDDTSLLDILSKRSDLGRPRSQSHFFFLPTQLAANSVLDQALDLGWDLEGDINEVADRGGLRWALTVQRSDRPTNHTTISEIREQFTRIADDAGGVYDGWQAVTDVGMDNPTENEAILLEELDDQDRGAIEELIPLLDDLNALKSPEALAAFLEAGRPNWEDRAAENPELVDDIIHLVGTAAGEQVARVTGLLWVLMVQGDTEEIVLADAERGVVRPYSMATEWWQDGGETDVADFIRAAILMVTEGQ